MNREEKRDWRLLFWALHTAGWLAFALVMVYFNYTDEWKNDPPLLFFLSFYAIGFLICIPLRIFFRRVGFHRRPLGSSIFIGASSSFLMANIWLGVDVLISLLLMSSPEEGAAFWKVYVAYILSRIVPLLGWSSLYFGIKIWKEWEVQGERVLRAHALAQAAQLQMLRYQINPHFLFNAMNSIRALIDENEAKAREMITELSEFLRYSLVGRDQADVPLREELEAIQYYFAIQKKRYEDKLEVQYDIEPRAGDVPVPSFLVHPLVENAVKYGMRTGPIPLVIHVAARVEGGSLVIEVRNTGTWVRSSTPGSPDNPGTGTGLDNVRRRLEFAFPGRQRIVHFEKDGYVHVQLIIQGQGET